MKEKSIESKQKDRLKMNGTDKDIEKLKQKLESIQSSFSSEEHKELGIPIVPEPPKREDKLTKDSPDLSPDVLKRMKKVESPDTKVVLVNCERCNAVIPIPIPKKVVLESILPIVPVSYVHKNLEKEDQHCITIHLDHDFDIRRQRLSDVVLSSD
ncbi:MAG: hypothetical protein ACFFE4_10470 [Candidatus Thorarchaeota archaeon]